LAAIAVLVVPAVVQYLDSMFSDDGIGVHEATDNVWKDLLIDNRRT